MKKPRVATPGLPFSLNHHQQVVDTARTVRVQALNNRLPILASEIRAAHEDIQRGALALAERALAAGAALTEAKFSLPHGEWADWLSEHTGLSARTATRYMQLSRSGLKSATVADLGIKAASASLSRVRRPPPGPARGYYAYCDFDDGNESWIWRPDPARELFHIVSWVALHYGEKCFALYATKKPVQRACIDLTLMCSDFPAGSDRFYDFPDTPDVRAYMTSLRVASFQAVT